MLGRPFWGRYSHGIIDWLALNVVLYLALTAQVGPGLVVRQGWAGLAVGRMWAGWWEGVG